MIVRNSTMHDVDSIMRIINQAKEYFKENNIDQWQDGYPDEETITNDINQNVSYVLEDNHQIIGTMFYACIDDPTYKVIKEGDWLNHEPYGVVHRIVVDNNVKGRGLASYLMNYAKEQTKQKGLKSVRIDTHKDNISMQKFLNKQNFTYCGIITLETGAPRIAFECLL